MLTIVVALAVVLAGVVAIALLGSSENAVLAIPESIGNLLRTPSEEVSTPDDLVATYMSGSEVAVLSVTRTETSDTPATCTTDAAVPSTHCNWVSDGLAYTLVENTAVTATAATLSAQAEQAVRAVNG